MDKQINLQGNIKNVSAILRFMRYAFAGKTAGEVTKEEIDFVLSIFDEGDKLCVLK